MWLFHVTNTTDTDFYQACCSSRIPICYYWRVKVQYTINYKTVVRRAYEVEEHCSQDEQQNSTYTRPEDEVKDILSTVSRLLRWCWTKCYCGLCVCVCVCVCAGRNKEER